jgi:hypothetical protein
MTIHIYRKRLHTFLSPVEHAVFKKLTTAHKIQDFLDSIPVYMPPANKSIRNPQQVLREMRAHCMEGAVLAAAALAYHGQEPLLMDLQTKGNIDYDHVVTLFKENRHWGAISKTNHPVLRWRDPIYKTVRELAMTYTHEYYLPDKGQHYRTKTMSAYSAPFNLRRYRVEEWLVAADINHVALDLDESRHFPTIPRGAKLRKATELEIKSLKLSEWSRSGKRLI